MGGLGIKISLHNFNLLVHMMRMIHEHFQGREAVDIILQLLRDRGYLRGDIPLRYKRQLPTLANKTISDDNKSIIYHVKLEKGFEEVMSFYIDGHIYLLSRDGVVLGTPLGVVRCDPRVIKVRLSEDRMMTFEIPIKG